MSQANEVRDLIMQVRTAINNAAARQKNGIKIIFTNLKLMSGRVWRNNLKMSKWSNKTPLLNVVITLLTK